MIRLFLALNIPEEIKSRLIEIRDSVAGLNYNWEKKEKLHLTIKFIGDFPETDLNYLGKELDFIKDFSSVKCSINKFGFFFKDNKPSILWAGMEVDKGIIKIVDEVNSFFERYFISKDKRKFNPHLTLLRIKNNPGNDFVNKFKNYTFNSINFIADSITLYKSELHSDGSKYFEIKNYKLKELE